MLIAVGGPREQRLHVSETQLVRAEHCAQNLVIGGDVTVHCPFGERSQQVASTIPIDRNRKQRQGPAQVPPIAATCWLGDRVEPGRRQRAVEKRCQRVGVADGLAAHNVATVQSDERLARFDDGRARSQSEVGPYYPWLRVTRALGAEHRPPRESPVKIASRAQRVMKGKQPSQRERGKRPSRSIVLVVRPHQILTRPRNSPFLQRLAANEWAKHVALDQSCSAAAAY